MKIEGYESGRKEHNKLKRLFSYVLGAENRYPIDLRKFDHKIDKSESSDRGLGFFNRLKEIGFLEINGETYKDSKVELTEKSKKIRKCTK